MRLNLGSGNEPLPGWTNVDARDVPGIDVVADVTDLPFEDASADEVLASSLLEHFKDPYEVLDEIWRVLAPRGSFTMLSQGWKPRCVCIASAARPERSGHPFFTERPLRPPSVPFDIGSSRRTETFDTWR